MTPALQGYLAAVSEQLAEAGALQVAAEELEAVAELIEDHHDLAVTLSDAAVPVSARRRVLDELLADRVRAEVRDLVTRTVALVAASELTTALHWLATQIRLLVVHLEEQAAQPVAEPVLGLMASRHRVAGFAAAALATVSTEEFGEVEDDLFRLARTIESNRSLRVALSDRSLPVHVRTGVVDDLIGGKVHAVTERLVRYAVRAGRPRDLVGTLDMLVNEVARLRGWRVATVHTADGIDDARRQRLREALERLTGGSVELHLTSDPRLVGGVVVEVGDLLVDASTRHRLDQLREHLLTHEGSFHVAEGREES